MQSYHDIPNVQDRSYLHNDLAFAMLTNIPITPGHSLIVPTRVVATFAELTPEEIVAIHSLASQVTKRLTEKLGAEGFNFAWNQGANYGQSIPHFHLHIVPRTPGDSGILDYEPRKFLYRPGSRETTPEAELEAFTQSLRS